MQFYAGRCPFVDYNILQTSHALIVDYHRGSLRYSSILPAATPASFSNTLIDYSWNEMDFLITVLLTTIPGHNSNKR